MQRAVASIPDRRISRHRLRRPEGQDDSPAQAECDGRVEVTGKHSIAQ